MKKLFTAIAAVFVLIAVCISISSAAKSSDDPADSYQKQTAPMEDSDISLWFEPSFKKVFTGDTTPSGKDTYSIYMAKNEVENAQFVLYSDTDKTKMKASVTDFSNANGDTIPAEIYYEMYVTVDNVNTQSILGTDDSSYLIRNGEIPDPVAPMSRIRTFSLVGGKSQAFFIKLRSSENTPPGWYSARLDITDESGNVVKTAEVYAYVWDFVISEKTELQTAFYLTKDLSYGGTYKDFYDYLLDNRLCAMDIPMEGSDYMNPSNPYFSNDRVSAIRVSKSGCGNVTDYLESPLSAHKSYSEIYDRMRRSDIWDDVKDKLYFYIADEPLPVPDDHARDNVDDVMERARVLRSVWKDARIVVPICEEHAYPNASYTAPLSSYNVRDLYDSTQAFMDNESLTLWCPRIYAFTPKSEIDAYGKYAGIENGAGWSDQIRTMSGPYSAAFSNSYYSYFNWESINGYYADRFNSYMNEKKAEGKDIESWAYSAGWNKSYSYCNHLIENTGLQTKMLFWQLYQEDVTGYLYYGVNLWDENRNNNNNFFDTTATGAKTGMKWHTNKLPYANGFSIYGNGVLLYGPNQGGIRGVNVIGSLRVEIMRDGVEEYQMFKMLEDLCGKNAAKEIVSKVSKNVVNYLSMPNFERSASFGEADEYDIMECVRRELGNKLEEASRKAKCEHKWNSGTVIREATCLEMGEMLFKCSECGAEKAENISALHTAGECFETVSGHEATCSSDSTLVLRCRICGYEKRDRTKAFHSDPNHYVYTAKSGTSNHTVSCDVCGGEISVQAHTFYTESTATCTENGIYEKHCQFCDYVENTGEAPAKGHSLREVNIAPTCEADGYKGFECKRCDYTEGEKIAAKGHTYEKGVCTVCGKADPNYTEVLPGDVNGDGYLDSDDAIALLNYTLGHFTVEGDMNLDFNSDTVVNSDDAVYLLYHVLLPNLYPLYK